MTKQTTDAVGR